MSELTLPWPTRRLWLVVALLSVLLALGVFGAGVAVGRRGSDTGADAAYAALVHAHTRQLVADRDSLRQAATAIETVYVAKRTTARQAVAAVANATTARDSITALVDAVAKQDDALAAADTMPAAEHAVQRADTAVTHSVEQERDLWKAAAERPLPRTFGTVAYLYDPLTAVQAVSGQLGVRLLGNVSAIVRADQRFAIDERPRLYVGASLAF